MVSYPFLIKLQEAYSRAENLGGLASLPGGIYAYRGVGLSCQARRGVSAQRTGTGIHALRTGAGTRAKHPQ